MTRRKFKVGDKVVSKVDRSSCKKGWIGTVTFYSNREYSVKMPNGFTYYFTGAELDAYVEEPKKVEKPAKKKEHKFKVGDIVRGISEKYRITNHDMTKGEVVKCGETVLWVKVLEHTNKRYIGGEFPVEYRYFAKVEEKEEPKNTIVIYQRDRDVVALDKTTGQKCYAHCHPDDKFDFKTGAKIAFGRLIGEPVETKPINKEPSINQFEKGKTYIFDKETFLREGGSYCHSWVYDCDGKVVQVERPLHGTINGFGICPWWCKEVKDPTIKVGDLIKIIKPVNGIDVRGCRGVVKEVHPNDFALVEFTTPTVTGRIYLTFKEIEKVN